jgi:hypothetical protein
MKKYGNKPKKYLYQLTFIGSSKIFGSFTIKGSNKIDFIQFVCRVPQYTVDFIAIKI